MDRASTPRPATIEAARIRLIALLPSEIEALIDFDAERAGRLAGVRFPTGWPEEPEPRQGLSWHLRQLQSDTAQAAWTRTTELRDGMAVWRVVLGAPAAPATG